MCVFCCFVCVLLFVGSSFFFFLPLLLFSFLLLLHFSFFSLPLLPLLLSPFLPRFPYVSPPLFSLSSSPPSSLSSFLLLLSSSSSPPLPLLPRFSCPSFLLTLFCSLRTYIQFSAAPLSRGLLFPPPYLLLLVPVSPPLAYRVFSSCCAPAVLLLVKSVASLTPSICLFPPLSSPPPSLSSPPPLYLYPPSTRCSPLYGASSSGPPS